MDSHITLTQDSRISPPITPDATGRHWIHVHKENGTSSSIRLQVDFGDPLAGTYDNIVLLRQGISMIELSTQASYQIVLDNNREDETCHVRIYD